MAGPPSWYVVFGAKENVVTLMLPLEDEAPIVVDVVVTAADTAESSKAKSPTKSKMTATSLSLLFC